MDEQPLTTLLWRKSRASGSGNCVEVAAGHGSVYVRDSKAPDAGALVFTPSEWTAFLAGVDAGEFTLPELGA
jgi:hypothetical protein